MTKRHHTSTKARCALLIGAGCLLVAALAGAAGAADPLFVEAAGSPVQVGAEPHSVAAADLNRDGKLDLATANYGSDDVSILLGNGAGQYSASPPVAVGDGPMGLAIGDLNRDGKLDIAVANADSDNLSILLGNGAGGFNAAGPPMALANGPWYVAIGDLNRDHRLDIVVAHVGFSGTNVPGTEVSILLGDGTGGFAHASGSPITVGQVPYGVEIVDLNHDHKPDLAVASQFGQTVWILLGDGNGRFTNAAGSPLPGSAPSWVASAHFNRDSHRDLAYSNQGSNTVTVMLGNGAGGFTPAPGSPVAVGRGPTALRAADFSLDGKVDLAVTNFRDNNVSILVGDGRGRFTPAPTSPHAVGPSPLSMAVADLNRDHKPDLTVANHGSTTVTVLLNVTPSPVDAIVALRERVRASAVKPSLKLRLVVKLLAAEVALRSGSTHWTCRALDSFVDDVRAHAGTSGLTTAAAQAWIDEANAIRNDVGCT